MFDAVLSTYDSLNHLPDLSDVETVFHNVAGALRPGGTFLFDLNTEEGYRVRWRGSFSIIADDHVLAARSHFDPATQVGTVRLALFQPDQGRWRRTDLTLLQRCYSDVEVRGALRAAGFASVEVSDAERDWGISGHTGRAISLAVPS